MNDSKVRLIRFWLLAVVGVFLAVMPARSEDTAGLFKAKCAVCHGTDGKGDTAVGKKLGVRDFASPEVQKETDEELIEVTTKGRNKMPAYGGILKDSQIKDLVAYIRELAKAK
ncbi:MAG: c-type cytochrome [Candidatus Acidiferrales bacterium]